MTRLLGLDSALKQSIFSGYVLLWVACHVLVYASRRRGAPAYNATSVVIITEGVKLGLALGLYFTYDVAVVRGSRVGTAWKQLVSHVTAAPDLPFRYAAPALLYCIYNNLVYSNLTAFDPGTYNVLMQLRIVITGLLYQAIFSRRLDRNQWLAIGCIAVGCVVKESEKIAFAANVEGVLRASLGAWLLLLVQMLCSVLAGVYNELLLKDLAAVPTNLQNVYMYLNSVLFNILVLVLQGKLGEALALDNLRTVSTPPILAIILIMSSVGVVTGFFLRHLDSVLKAVASAFEVVLSTLVSYAFFGVPLGPQAVAAGLLVGCGVALYSRPVASSRLHAYARVATEQSRERVIESGSSGNALGSDVAAKRQSA
mmetsp:Transcript_679/g.2041  ORF Transcript_679/g.2041 Transcript_679/m.2041 type:complete len:369 (+) Transcript_679:54-1160(+)